MWSERSTDSEYMDRTDFGGETAAACFRFIERTNRWLGGYGPVCRLVRREWRRQGCPSRFRILDVGAGTGDVARAVLRFCRGRGIPAEVTCLERHGQAAAYAAAHVTTVDGLHVVCADVREFRPEDPFHCVTACMFLHHFCDGDVPELLALLGELTSGRVLVVDLYRGPLAYWSCRVLTAAAPHVLRHDACLSVRKGFRPAELQTLAERIPGARCRTGRTVFQRVWAAVRFPHSSGAPNGTREAANTRADGAGHEEQRGGFRS